MVGGSLRAQPSGVMDFRESQMTGSGGKGNDAAESSPAEQPTETPMEIRERLFGNADFESRDQASNGVKKTRECDFDTNPTKLYLLIQGKKWDEAAARSVAAPEESYTWVSRKERDGKLRWRLLPLHAAVIFRAPGKCIEALLSSYPAGAQCKDDQGMLPIHLAFRNGSSEGVVNVLLVAYPQSIDVKDRKGRIPLVLAQASNSPNRDAFIRALERGPSYYAVAAAATERAAVTAEQRAIFDSKMINMKNDHSKEIQNVRRQAEAEKIEMKDRIASLEMELAKTQETSQVLVDHVNSLEAQLSTRSDTERFLATKIANLDSTLKDTAAAKESVETKLRFDNERLQNENDDLKIKVMDMERDLSESRQRAEENEGEVHSVRTRSEEDRRKTVETLKSLELECANSRANAAVLEAQLKKKIETEHTLASQVSDLASKLAESAAATSTATAQYAKKVESLERDKAELKAAVETLTAKLTGVASALDAMAAEQERIVAAAARHERTMAEASEAQQRIVADTARQEEALIQASSEREQIVNILTRQAEEVERATTERDRIMDMVRKQEEDMASATREREELIDSVTRQKMSMKELRDKEVAGLINWGNEALRKTTTTLLGSPSLDEALGLPPTDMPPVRPRVEVSDEDGIGFSVDDYRGETSSILPPAQTTSIDDIMLASEEPLGPESSVNDAMSTTPVPDLDLPSTAEMTGRKEDPDGDILQSADWVADGPATKAFAELTSNV